MHERRKGRKEEHDIIETDHDLPTTRWSRFYISRYETLCPKPCHTDHTDPTPHMRAKDLCDTDRTDIYPLCENVAGKGTTGGSACTPRGRLIFTRLPVPRDLLALEFADDDLRKETELP